MEEPVHFIDFVFDSALLSFIPTLRANSKIRRDDLILPPRLGFLGTVEGTRGLWSRYSLLWSRLPLANDALTTDAAIGDAMSIAQPV